MNELEESFEKSKEREKEANGEYLPRPQPTAPKIEKDKLVFETEYEMIRTSCL